jgi:hypothetical protein
MPLWLGWKRLVDSLVLSPLLGGIPGSLSFAFIFAGGLVFFMPFVVTPSYNTYNSAAVMGSLGFFFLSLQRCGLEASKPGGAIFYAFASGLVVGFGAFVKWPTSVCVLVLYVIVFVFWPGVRVPLRMSLVGAFLAGNLSWAAIYFVFVQPFHAWRADMSLGFSSLRFISGSSYGPSEILRYVREFVFGCLYGVKRYQALYFAVLIWCGVIVSSRRWKERFERSLGPLIILVFISAMCKEIYRLYRHWPGDESPTLFLTALSILLMFIATVILLFKKSILSSVSGTSWLRLGLISSVLLSVPFASVVGTGRLIASNAGFCMAPWFAFLIMLLAFLSHSIGNGRVLYFGTMILTILICVQVVSGFLFSPYRLAGNVLLQNRTTEVGSPPSLLRLDSETSRVIDELEAILRTSGFEPGGDILAFYDMPGLVYAVGGRSPGAPWFSNHWMAYYEALLALAPHERVKKAFIFRDLGCDDDIPDLSWAGMRFPEDYVLCGEVPFTDSFLKIIQVWKPKGE